MLPDLDATQRLTVAKVTAVDIQGTERKNVAAGVTLPYIEDQWFSYYHSFKAKYNLDEKQQSVTDALVDQYVTSLRDYTAEKVEDINAYLGSLKRHSKREVAGTNQASHQKKRDWDDQMKLRREGESLIAEPEKLGANMQFALWHELKAAQKALGELPPIAYGDNRIPLAGVITMIPFIKDFATPSRLGFLDLSVTLGLSAIGICLILGFCSRLAALAGAAFMFNVCLSQFPWPTIYPHPPEVVGHYMIFNKDSAELFALLLLAAVPAGRWGGLDWFLWNFGGKKLWTLYGFKKDPLTPDGMAPETTESV